MAAISAKWSKLLLLLPCPAVLVVDRLRVAVVDVIQDVTRGAAVAAIQVAAVVAIRDAEQTLVPAWLAVLPVAQLTPIVRSMSPIL